ncbi:MAG: peptidoglycan-binding protein [Alphaproteobacteria bacterium]|nr:peptidoglycan-binding protein [Alphaproteobacteria bacterium]
MSWLKLKRPMDEAANADYGDIVNAKRALLQLGYYQPPGGGAIGAWVDGPLFEGIRRFQRDNRLKVDGVMRPGGPTEAVMNRRLERASSQPPRSFRFDQVLPDPCSCREWDANPYLM